MSLDRAILFRLGTSAVLERAVRSVSLTERTAWHAASRYVAGTDAATPSAPHAGSTTAASPPAWTGSVNA